MLGTYLAHIRTYVRVIINWYLEHIELMLGTYVTGLMLENMSQTQVHNATMCPKYQLGISLTVQYNVISNICWLRSWHVNIVQISVGFPLIAVNYVHNCSTMCSQYESDMSQPKPNMYSILSKILRQVIGI